MQKYTKSEGRPQVISPEETKVVDKALEKFGKSAVSELTEDERRETVESLDSGSDE